MSWIKEINYEEADNKLKNLYDKIKGPNNYIDNVMKVHSLRPNTLEAHMRIYKNVLHHFENKLPKWFLETLGIYVSILNKCEYCKKHHFNGLTKIVEDNDRTKEILNALEKEDFEATFSDKEKIMLRYAKILTENPSEITQGKIEELREKGYGDGEILEANQVISYFSYVNRTVLGLGVDTEGDILGLSPNDNSNPNNWSHK